RRTSHTRKLSLSGKHGGKRGSGVARLETPTGMLGKGGVSVIKGPGRSTTSARPPTACLLHRSGTSRWECSYACSMPGALSYRVRPHGPRSGMVKRHKRTMRLIIAIEGAENETCSCSAAHEIARYPCQ